MSILHVNLFEICLKRIICTEFAENMNELYLIFLEHICMMYENNTEYKGIRYINIQVLNININWES